MNLQSSQELFLWVNLVALAMWLTIAVINNVHAFNESVAAINRTTSMELIQTAPRIVTVFSERALTSPAWAKLALAGVLVMQALACLALWAGIAIHLSGSSKAAALVWVNCGLTVTTAFVLAMLIAGNWFAYWIRQSDLQLTHIALLLWPTFLFVASNIKLA